MCVYVCEEVVWKAISALAHLFSSYLGTKRRGNVWPTKTVLNSLTFPTWRVTNPDGDDAAAVAGGGCFDQRELSPVLQSDIRIQILVSSLDDFL